MIGNKGQKDREEKLSQFIDELNQEKKPSIQGLDMEEDKELYELLDTVKAVKRLKEEECPDTPKFNEYNRRSKRSNFLKYGAIAACLMIAVMAAVGNRDILRTGFYTKDSSLKQCTGLKEESKESAVDDCNTIPEGSQLKNGSKENIATIYTSCSAAASLLGGLPEGLQIAKVVKLEDSPYTYYVSCSWNESSFIDMYILPGEKGYGMDYGNSCYSFMGGVIEEDTAIVGDLKAAYGEEVNAISWTGDTFTIMLVSDREPFEIRSVLEEVTDSKAVLLTQQEKDKINK